MISLTYIAIETKDLSKLHQERCKNRDSMCINPMYNAVFVSKEPYTSHYNDTVLPSPITNENLYTIKSKYQPLSYRNLDYSNVYATTVTRKDQC